MDLAQDTATGELIITSVSPTDITDEYWYTPLLLTNNDFFTCPSYLHGQSTYSFSIDVFATSDTGVIYSEEAFSLYLERGYLRASHYDGTTSQTLSVRDAIRLGRWNTITVTRTPSEYTLYLNGELTQSLLTVNGAGQSTAGQATIGRDFLGSLCFLKISDIAYTSTQALSLYREGVGNPYADMSASFSIIHAYDITSDNRLNDLAGSDFLTSNDDTPYSVATRFKNAIATQEVTPISKTLRLTYEGTQTIAQRIHIRLHLFLGEWIIDRSEGTPWYQKIFKKGIEKTEIDSLLRARILGTTGVTGILNLESTLEGREYSMTFVAQATNNVIVTGSLVENTLTIQ